MKRRLESMYEYLEQSDVLLKVVSASRDWQRSPETMFSELRELVNRVSHAWHPLRPADESTARQTRWECRPAKH
ncbi:hypothetical protein E2C01_065070 [Portunus trituberculatus]|uniref:Uncharacterized protein n=1 Tax=Portunus trituberculatus TaxID=210409 RepID=A0A5B7HDI0_PORTR|nr:hypothetical protein [Portunus trituberculatus]